MAKCSGDDDVSTDNPVTVTVTSPSPESKEQEHEHKTIKIALQANANAYYMYINVVFFRGGRVRCCVRCCYKWDWDERGDARARGRRD